MIRDDHIKTFYDKYRGETVLTKKLMLITIDFVINWICGSNLESIQKLRQEFGIKKGNNGINSKSFNTLFMETKEKKDGSFDICNKNYQLQGDGSVKGGTTLKSIRIALFKKFKELELDSNYNLTLSSFGFDIANDKHRGFFKKIRELSKAKNIGEVYLMYFSMIFYISNQLRTRFDCLLPYLGKITLNPVKYNKDGKEKTGYVFDFIFSSIFRMDVLQDINMKDEDFDSYSDKELIDMFNIWRKNFIKKPENNENTYNRYGGSNDVRGNKG